MDYMKRNKTQAQRHLKMKEKISLFPLPNPMLSFELIIPKYNYFNSFS